MSSIEYKNLTEDDFQQVITLGNAVHGDGYLNDDIIADWHKKGLSGKNNLSYVAYDGKKLVGFRITFACEHWQIDQWCTPTLWQVATEKTCYFKCNTVDEHHRGLGIGKKLLQLSIAAAKLQGAEAGVSHLWKQSPKNSAVSYFTQCGGKLVALHPEKWNEDSKNGYDCILCGFDCHCEAAEMIIYFK